MLTTIWLLHHAYKSDIKNFQTAMETQVMCHLITAFLFSASALVPIVAHATPITYTFSTTASGDLGSVIFNDAFVTVTVDADTANVSDFEGVISNHATGGVDLSINGVGTTVFTAPASVVNDGNQILIIFDETGAALLAETSNDFTGYELNSAFGPVTASFGQSTASANTSAGDFRITSDSGDSTFTAALDSTVSPVPEPSTLWFLGTGTLGLLGASRQKLKHQLDISQMGDAREPMNSKS
jgi:hypothetical protein